MVGRAVVSTSVGVQGLPDIGQAGVQVADAPTDFAAAVLEALNNTPGRVALQQQARQYVSARFAPEVVFGAFADRIARHVHRQPLTDVAL